MSDGIEPLVEAMLRELGEDPKREGLLKTPSRVARSMRFLTKGYEQDPAEIIGGALFNEDYEEMIVMKDIDFFSQCEHHMLPFYGKAHVAYIPDGKIVGISKIARLVEVYARRLQVQERLTKQIAQTMMEQLQPAGVAVVVEAEHLCMRMRGVEKQNSVVVSSAVFGVFRSNQETREEFMSLVHNGLSRR